MARDRHWVAHSQLASQAWRCQGPANRLTAVIVISSAVEPAPHCSGSRIAAFGAAGVAAGAAAAAARMLRVALRGLLAAQPAALLALKPREQCVCGLSARGPVIQQRLGPLGVCACWEGV